MINLNVIVQIVTSSSRLYPLTDADLLLLLPLSMTELAIITRARKTTRPMTAGAMSMTYETAA